MIMIMIIIIITHGRCWMSPNICRTTPTVSRQSHHCKCRPCSAYMKIRMTMLMFARLSRTRPLCSHNSRKSERVRIALARTLHLVPGGRFRNCSTLFCSVLFFSRPRSEGWPHHKSFSICPCPLSFWLTLPRRVLSTSWCCPFRPWVAFLAFVHPALFLALFLSPGNSLVSSWCDHSMLASLLWRCLTVHSLLQLC